MQPKRENQPTFFDLAVQQRGSANRVLETTAREVDFTAAAYRHGGRPACRVGVLLRVMILQHLYGLSNPQAEEQINLGLARNQLELRLKAVAYNLKRLAGILEMRRAWKVHRWTCS